MKTIIIIVVILVIIGGGYLLMRKKTDTNVYQTPDVLLPTPNPAPTPSPLPTPTPTTPNPTPTPTPTPSQPTPPPTNPNPVTHNVTIQNLAYVQSSITIKAGDTVVWTNKDSAPHTVTGISGGPVSNTLQLNDTYTMTFSAPGTYNYHCNFHSNMTGVVRVIP